MTQTRPTTLDPSAAISWLLRAGVYASLTLILLGSLILAIQTRPGPMTSDRSTVTQLLQHGDQTPASLSDALSQALHGRGGGIILLGAGLLIATPFLRVLLSIVVFARQHDGRFVVITSFVLAMMIVAVAVGVWTRSV